MTVESEENARLGKFTSESAFELDMACQEARAWMEAILQQPFLTADTPRGFHEAIRNGQYLCRVINSVKPNAVRRVNKSTAPFACLENVTYFLDACRELGLKDTQLFESTGLCNAPAETPADGGIGSLKQSAQRKDQGRKLRDVCITIYWLGRAVRSMRDYSGPQLNLSAFVRLTCARCNTSIDCDSYAIHGSLNFHNHCLFCDECGLPPSSPSAFDAWECSSSAMESKRICLCLGCQEKNRVAIRAKVRALTDTEAAANSRVSTEPETETEVETKTKTNFRSNAKAHTDTETISVSGAETEAVAKSKSEAETEKEAGSKAKTERKREAGSKAQKIGTETEAVSKARADAESRTKTGAAAIAKTESPKMTTREDEVDIHLAGPGSGQHDAGSIWSFAIPKWMRNKSVKCAGLRGERQSDIESQEREALLPMSQSGAVGLSATGCDVLNALNQWRYGRGVITGAIAYIILCVYLARTSTIRSA